jgi:lipopolysaccharide transport system permease protein
LFKRDFLAGYKKSFIGFTWIFISPVMGIISWVFLKQTGMLQPGDVGIPYPAYVLIGSSMWGLFMGFYDSSGGTLKAGAGFIMQVNYPHEALLFKQVAQKLANFLIGFSLNILILFAFEVVPNWKIVLLPLVVLPMFFLGSALGLIVSMISVVAFDLNKGITMIMGLLLYITPVIYSDKISNPLVQNLIKWNPLTYLVCSARDIVIYGTLYNSTGYAICTGISVLLFLISWRLFYVSEHNLIERMI